jgi:hypothetical protein
MPGVKPNSVKRSWITLAGAAIIAGIAFFLLNSPATKTLKFYVVCETFVTPASLTLNLSQDPTELQSVVATDFDGYASDATSIQLAPNQQKLAPIPAHTLTLQLDNNTNHPISQLSLSRRGRVGELMLKVEPRVELSSVGIPGAASSLTLVSRAGNDIRLKISSAKVDIDKGNYYIIPEVQAGQFDAFHAALEGRDLVAMNLKSGSRRDTGAVLTFNTEQRNQPMLKAAQVLPGPITLIFRRAVNPTLRLDENAVQGVILDRKTDLVAECESATLDMIELVGEPEKRGLPALSVYGGGKVRSLRQDGHQLMATRLQEILDRPFTERNLWLIGLGAVVAVFLKAVDHALGILLEKLIPKG